MASTPTVDIVRFHHNPGPSHPHMKEEYWIVCNDGMADKWRKDPSISLVDVVQSFDIFAGTGRSYRPAKHELASVFGVEQEDEMIKKILREGKIVPTAGFAGRPHHN